MRIPKDVKNHVTLKDALQNLAPDSGASDEYCSGLTVGLVSGLIACGFTWRDAIIRVAENLPANHRAIQRTFPESWVDTIRNERIQATQNLKMS